MLVQSGRPVGVLRTHEWAPRVLIANSNLVGDWATWPEFRRLEQLGLTMYGQMTAGSWIYIGTQGILQGTYETFAAVAAKRFGGTLAGTLTLTAGCGGMGGAQPLAVTMNGGVCLVVDVDPARLRRRVEHRYLDEVADDLDDAVARCLAAKRDRRAAVASAWSATPPTVFPELLRRGVEIDIVTDQTSAHDPLSLPARGRRPRRLARLRRRPSPRSSPTGPAPRWPSTSRRWSASWTPAPRSSTTATRSAARRGWAATSGRSPSPASCPPTSGRCSARARARSAGRRCPATRPTSPPPTAPSSTCSPRTSPCSAGSAPAQEQVAFQGLPARICWLGYGERDMAGLRFNEMVASGELSAPIVIGRDHLDSGSVASPVPGDRGDGRRLRRDRRLAAAQRPGQHRRPAPPGCRSTTAAASASAGRIHAGQVSVADGTPLAAAEARAGAHQRPGHGRDPARRRRLRPGRARSPSERGIRVPMAEG